MELIRKDTDYAMRALVQLAQHGQQEPVPTGVLARSQDIPLHFAQKILRRLKRAGIIEGRMGSKGGFSLARSAGQIDLLEVVEAIQGPVTVRECCLGLDTCPRRPSCPISAKLVEVQTNLLDSLKNITLADISEAKHV